MKTKLIKTAFTMITAITLTIAACTPTTSTTPIHGGYPTCTTLPTTRTCIEINTIDDQGNGSGVVFQPNGQAQLINFWSDGTIETY